MSKREYKSSVFSMLLEEPEYALDVYNALNGTDYCDAENALLDMTFEKREKLIARDNRELGREEGIEQGKLVNLLTIIKKKILKNKNVQTISEELEENQERLEPLYNLISENPDKEIDELVSMLNKKNS